MYTIQQRFGALILKTYLVRGVGLLIYNERPPWLGARWRYLKHLRVWWSMLGWSLPRDPGTDPETITTVFTFYPGPFDTAVDTFTAGYRHLIRR